MREKGARRNAERLSSTNALPQADPFDEEAGSLARWNSNYDSGPVALPPFAFHGAQDSARAPLVAVSPASSRRVGGGV